MAKQIYCITNALNLETDRAYPVCYQDISMMIKDISSGTDFKFVPNDVYEYQAVIERVAGGFNDSTVIPVKFGTIAKDEDDIDEIMKIGYPKFKKAIEAMSGKIQIEVLVLWNNLGMVLKDIGKREDIKRFKEDIALMAAKEYQSSAIELGAMVKTALDEESSKKRGEITEDLKGFIIDFKMHDLMDDKMIMNAAFLAERDNIGMLREKIDRLGKRYEGNIDFKIIGPLPPYSFSTVEIKRIGSQDIEDAMFVMGVSDGMGNTSALPTEDVIDIAYKTMIKRWHPDKNIGDPAAQKRFERIKQLHHTIVDCIQNSGHPSKTGDFIVVKVV